MSLVKVGPRNPGLLIEEDPRFDAYTDVLCVPTGIPEWPAGIYDRGRKLITAATNFRCFPTVSPLFGSYVITNDTSAADDCDQELFFLGHVPNHYGHFLTMTLPRLWPLRFERNRKIKFLTTDNPATMIDRYPFMQSIFQQLGIGQSDIVSFIKPTWIKRLLVPSPSLEENNYAHESFARLCQAIGWSLVNNMPLSPTDKPVYFSKHKLRSGVFGIENETDICEILEASGFDIICPETLSFKDQVKLIMERSILTGFVGSVFHTTLFSGRKRISCLTYQGAYTENHSLIDQLCGHNSEYFYPSTLLERAPSDGRFKASYRITDARKLADDFCRTIDHAIAA